MSKIYQYHFRPGYKSETLLIDIFGGGENENFNSDFLTTIAIINPKMTDILDLWMNNEVLMTFDSDAGQFTIAKDIWGLVFIMADANQKVLKQINSILEISDLFEKIEVDFEHYQ